MQDHAADHLHVEMALANGALGGLAHGGEGFRDQIVERGAFAHSGAERLGAGAQILVAEGHDLGLQRIDGCDRARIFLEPAVVG